MPYQPQEPRRPAEAQTPRRPAGSSPAPRRTAAGEAQQPVRRTASSGKYQQPRRTAPAGQQPVRRTPPGTEPERRRATNTQMQNPRRRRRRRRRNNNLLLLLLIAAVLIAAVVLLGKVLKPGSKEEAEPTTEATEPEIVHQVSTATISATGDILMHLPVINTGLKTDGSYDFSNMFRYVSSYASAADYAAANLETTLCGTGNGYKYSGFPCFNCPDEIVDALKGAGFDMLLTANNHCYDTGAVGYRRTIETIHKKGLDNLGTMASAEDPKYIIQEINGIKIGMLCYTYEQPIEEPESGIVYLNYIPMEAGGDQLINSFLPADMSPFYSEVDSYIKKMKQAGAEAIVMFIHWGIEYETSQNGEQRDIAQRLCDLGVDVIIGGHPHVVQPVQMLTSNTDADHKTLCLYSMGNAVSNQRKGNLTSIQTAHTEDGVLFSVTFSKYSDGTVYLDSTDLIPCWVKMDGSTDAPEAYTILPLDPKVKDQWQSRFELDDNTLADAQLSYDRTMAIVGSGMEISQNYLAQQRQARDDAYAGITEETGNTETTEESS